MNCVQNYNFFFEHLYSYIYLVRVHLKITDNILNVDIYPKLTNCFIY